jgi:molybdopterin converting factor small subunit
MRVRIPTPLRSYTANAANVTADGATLTEILTDLDRQYPGIKFRVVDEQGELRQHMVIWLNDERCRDLATRIDDVDEVVIMQALSGG